MPPRNKADKTNGAKSEAKVEKGKGTHQDKPLAEVVAGREIIHPQVKARVKFRKDHGGEGVLTVKMAEDLLGWESETQYKKRMVKEGKARIEQPEPEPEVELDGDQSENKGKKAKKPKEPKYIGPDLENVYTLKDFNGERVICWNNAVFEVDESEGVKDEERIKLLKTNRPFDSVWADGIGQDILNQKWRPNGEAVIIGKTGLVLSAQHRLAGLVLAGQRYNSESEGHHWKEIWGEQEPFIETVVTYGIDESDETTQTLDNVKPRSLTDTIYTSSNFNDLSRDGRLTCSKMLDQAVKQLWRRTGCGVSNEDQPNFSKRQTHAAELDLLYRHKGLEGMVRKLFNLDSEDKISLAKVSPGQCAGLGYLMGVSASDPDKYYPDNREERFLDKTLMPKAEQFWTDFADRTDTLAPLIDALAELVDLSNKDEEGNVIGLGGRVPEKQGVIVKAWNQYVAGEPIEFDDSPLEYHKDEDKGTIVLIDWPDVGGIDLGDPMKITKDDITAAQQKQIEAAKKKEEKEKAEELDRASKGVDKEGNRIALKAFVEAVKQKHMTHLLLFSREDGGYDIFGGDAVRAHGTLGYDVGKHPDPSMKDTDYLDVPPEVGVMAVQAVAKKFPTMIVSPDGKVKEAKLTPPTPKKDKDKEAKEGKGEKATATTATK